MRAFHAFLYDGSTMTDLGTLGGTLRLGLGINASDQIIANGTNAAGQERAFLLTPLVATVPLPAGLPLLLGALSVLGLARRQTKHV